MNKPTLAFVDHIFHQKTRSGDFLRELFSTEFTVKDYWIDPWGDKTDATVDALNSCDYIFFFQRMLQVSDLRKITKPMLWAQMYDSANTDRFYWNNLSYLPIKTLCFSKKVYELAKQNNVPAIYLQYYRDPAQYSPQNNRGRTFFFWNRGHIPFKEIKKILDPKDVDSFIYLDRADPNCGTDKLFPEEIQEYRIQKYDMDFVPTEKYLDLVSKADVFLSPRKKEGIGMSFLEALAMGQCVVGWNDGTMNEYIKDKHNGYLFDSTTGFIDFSNLEQIRNRSLNDARNGYENWDRNKKEVLSFFTAPDTRKKPGAFVQWIYYTLYKLKLWQFNLQVRYLKR